MKLLLQHNVENLGRAGDLVEVSSGYGRNYLLPHGLALEPTAGNLKRVDELKAKAKQEEFDKLQEWQVRAQALAGLEITIKARTNEQGHLFGSVGPADVAVALKEQGFEVPERAIMLDPHIKEIDKRTIEIMLAPEVIAEIQLWVVPETPLPEMPQVDDPEDESDVSEGQEARAPEEAD